MVFLHYSRAIKVEECAKSVLTSNRGPANKVKWQFALVCFDNIIMFSRMPDEHIDHVHKC